MVVDRPRGEDPNHFGADLELLSDLYLKNENEGKGKPFLLEKSSNVVLYHMLS